MPPGLPSASRAPFGSMLSLAMHPLTRQCVQVPGCCAPAAVAASAESRFVQLDTAVPVALPASCQQHSAAPCGANVVCKVVLRQAPLASDSWSEHAGLISSVC